jgi:CMP-N-acetylneuraminic acid synthetase|tara:strand:+ start:25855 stop:26502 length:648 start_codon:yes stop_codon:yes gene_type:complete
MADLHIHHKKFVALIPAKRTSVRVPEKNLRDLAGRPLLQYSINAATSLLPVERIFVSSEDAEIRRLAHSLGCERIKRPPALSEPDIPNVRVIEHALTVICEAGTLPKPEFVLLLQPTHPFRKKLDLVRAVEAMTSEPFPDYVISTRPDSSSGEPVNAGAFYLFKTTAFERSGSVRGQNEVRIALSRPDLEVDIDTEVDFQLALSIAASSAGDLDF